MRESWRGFWRTTWLARMLRAANSGVQLTHLVDVVAGGAQRKLGQDNTITILRPAVDFSEANQHTKEINRSHNVGRFTMGNSHQRGRGTTKS
jgi:hypothetical protein